MRRVIVWVVLLLLAVTPLWAQEAAPDYAIENMRSSFSQDGRQIIVEFEVHNLGGTAQLVSSISLIVLESNQLVDTISLRPLRADERVTVRFTFDIAAFPAGTLQTLQAQVASDEQSGAGQGVPTAALCVSFTPGALSTPGRCPALTDDPITYLIQTLGLPADRESTLRIIGIGAAVLLLLMIVWVTLRAAYQKTPAFGTGRPPYAINAPVDTNSIWGRRQLWQQHAHNDSLPANSAEGSVYARKLLLGVDNIYLSGWRIMALRVSQYDAYGRVAHSQILAPDSIVKRLNRAARASQSLARNSKLTYDEKRQRLSRLLQSAANTLAKRFARKLNNRSAMLPISLDIRFEGTHGEVRIVFELFQCQYGHWQQIDGWEPEMMVMGKTIYETYTFTVFGQMTSESLRDFKRRLPQDFTRFLVDCVLLSAPERPEPAGPPSPAQSASDTPNSGMKAVEPTTAHPE